MKVLVTGAAGFIGAATSQRLSCLGYEVIGIDNLNTYYNVQLKLARLRNIHASNFSFVEGDIANKAFIDGLFAHHYFDKVIHLAAQAGVRYSLENPMAYIESNLLGQAHILEACRQFSIKHLIYASSSSVYGLNRKVPFNTADSVDHPVSLYAATKKSDELMSHAYSHLYQLPTTGLRFFTVYGPWGRPDMAPMIFAKKIMNGEPIEVYNHGNLSRDFTYVDDIVEGVLRVMDYIPKNDPSWQVESGRVNESSAPYQIFNIGYGQPIPLMDFISLLEAFLGKSTQKIYMDMQAGDVYQTWADTNDLFHAVGYKPQIDLSTGIEKFVNWYRKYDLDKR